MDKQIQVRSYFQKILAELMQEHGLDAAKLAGGLGVNRASVEGWLSGFALPGYERLKLLCAYFGVSADMLLDILVN